jgi:signal transduction histidine kinase
VISVSGSSVVVDRPAAQGRHIAARLPRRRSVGARLAFSVAVSVAAVLATVTIAAISIANRQIDADVRETARVTAVALADEIELHEEPVSRDALVPLLRDFMNAATDLDSIDVFRLEDGSPVLLATTSTIDRPPTSLVQRAIRNGETTWATENGSLATVAVPIYSGERITGAVSVAISLASLGRIGRVVGIGAVVGGLIAITAITLVIYVLARRIILGPYESVMQLRDTAARAQQLAAVGQTMANVAHQIGTPLNLVSGHVQLLQQEVTDPGLKRRLTIVEEQVDRVAAAVRELLQRARPHAEPRLVQVGALLTRLSEAMRVRFAAAGVSVTTRVPADLPAVLADETQLELALLNLLVNAADAMPRGGVVTLSAQRSKQSVRIEVADTGTGIAADILPRIFEPWVTTKPLGNGTGLGLSIARDVIARAGGTIAVTSTPGAGTVFTIDLPTAAPAHPS